MDKIQTIIEKEWREVFKNRFVLFAVAFLPLIFAALPLITIYGMSSFGGLEGDIPFEGPGAFLVQCEGLSSQDCMIYYLLVGFMLMFMMIPMIIPITIAAYSIVGEKTTHTLEPLLATPITTLELLSGKGLAAAIPGILATWGGYLLFTIGARLMLGDSQLMGRLFDPLWLIAIFVVGPLLAIASVCLAVMVSSRTTEPRVAEQMSSLVLIPLVVFMVAQFAGLLVINLEIILWFGVILILVDAGLLYFATQLFQRETILTRWK